MKMNPAAFDAQLQVRRDAESLSGAVSDLTSWIEEIKTREGAPRGDGVRPCDDAADASLISGSCEELRMRGNELFAEGRYDDAIRCYSRSIKSAKDESLSHELLLAYSNRAMSNLKTKRWTAAEADATSALEIDPSHCKSLQRRATARLSLGKLRAAMVDVCSAKDCASGSFVDAQGEPEKQAAERESQEIERLSSRIDSALTKAISNAPRRKIAVRTISS